MTNVQKSFPKASQKLTKNYTNNLNPEISDIIEKIQSSFYDFRNEKDMIFKNLSSFIQQDDAKACNPEFVLLLEYIYDLFTAFENAKQDSIIK
jgi:hypothetical protein